MYTDQDLQSLIKNNQISLMDIEYKKNRKQIATACLQGILANGYSDAIEESRGNISKTNRVLVDCAVSIADVLLEKLEKEE